MKKPRITAERARELLRYDPETGAFTWRVSVGGRGAKNGNGKFKPGDPAGCDDGDGYLVIRLDGRLYRANRLAWLIATGEWPEGIVDHRDGARGDNRWDNLRDTTSTTNNQNRDALGVEFDKRSGRFNARIRAEGTRHSLGGYGTEHEAHSAYLAAKQVMHPGFVARIA